MPTRREYLAAAVTLTGTTLAGCTGETMSEDEANEVLDDATVIGELRNGFDVVRAIDRDAGIVLYMAGIGYDSGGGLTSVPIEDTDLGE